MELTKERAAGLEKDLERWARHSGEEFEMTVSGQKFGKDEKREAGEAILEACKGAHGIKTTVKIGEYKGFEMRAGYNFITRKADLDLRGGPGPKGLGLKGDGITHRIELSESATGNITRIANALEKIPERLESAKAHLKDLHKQLEDARAEMGRPFPQARELEEKSARLAELDILLNMDSQKQPGQKQEQEQEQEQKEVSETLQEDAETQNSAGEIAVPASTPDEAAGTADTKDENVSVEISTTTEEKLQARQPIGFVISRERLSQGAPLFNSGFPEKKQEEQGKNEAPANSPEEKEGPSAVFIPEVGQRVVFHPDGGTVKLAGEVVSIEEKTVTIRAGTKKIPVYRDKGRFEPEGKVIAINSARKEGNGFER
jgi:hypothetical protein